MENIKTDDENIFNMGEKRADSRNSLNRIKIN